jgi:TolB-like protein/DNA-binding winged helix-turn-helix (wHTH) protein
MPTAGPRKYRFGGFLLDPGARLLRRDGDVIALTPKEFKTLLLLVECHGQAVERDFLMRSIWPDTVVGDTSLARNISVLRRHLGTDAIESVPRYGYRFALAVSECETPSRQATHETEDKPAILLGPESAETVQTEAGKKVERRALGNLASKRTVTSGLLAIVLIVIAISLLDFRRRAHQTYSVVPVAAKASEPVRLAVLPFRNVSANPAQSDYLRDGMADELTARLGELSLNHLQILARSTTAQYVDTAKPASTISAETGAQYLLEGSVGFDGNDAHVSVNLVDATSQTVIWSQVLERPLHDLSGIQDEIANRIAATPTVAGTAHRQSTIEAESTSPEAHDEYLRGRFELAQSRRDSYQRALTHFERAVKIDDLGLFADEREKRLAWGRDRVSAGARAQSGRG